MADEAQPRVIYPSVKREEAPAFRPGRFTLADLLGLLRTLLAPRPLAPPTFTASITADELRQAILRDLGTDHVHLSDANYDLYSKSELERFLGDDRTNGRKYVQDQFDCDNYAAVLFGNESIWQDLSAGQPGRKGSSAFGILWGDIKGVGAHALNFWVAPDRTCHLVEPQNDKVFKLPDGSTVWFALC